MLILGWLLLGLSFLALEAGSLSYGAQDGQYLSIVGALKYDLNPDAQIPYSQWPWGDVSLGAVLSKSIKGIF